MLTGIPAGATSSDDFDIGPPQYAGATSFNAGTYTISKSGSDIWGRSDQLHLNRGTLTGNGTVTAYVKSVFVDLVVTSGDSVLFQSRPHIGRACVSAQVVGIKMIVTAACENRLGSR